MTPEFTSIYLMFFSAVVYLRSTPVKSCLSNLARRFLFCFTHTLEPKTFRSFRCGSWPVQASKGVFFVYLCTLRLWKYVAWRRAADQYFGCRAAPYNRAQTETDKVSFHFSTPPFCEGLSAPVDLTTYWCLSSSTVQKSALWASSPSLLHRTTPPASRL